MITGIVFFLFFGLYFLTHNQIFSFDAVTNAIACDSNELIRWFHPNHPTYPFLGILWSRFERSLSYGGYSIYSLARFNSILMASGLSILFLVLKKEVGKGRALLWISFL